MSIGFSPEGSQFYGGQRIVGVHVDAFDLARQRVAERAAMSPLPPTEVSLPPEPSHLERVLRDAGALGIEGVNVVAS